jgi:hypothetical protein
MIMFYTLLLLNFNTYVGTLIKIRSRKQQGQCQIQKVRKGGWHPRKKKGGGAKEQNYSAIFFSIVEVYLH